MHPTSLLAIVETLKRHRHLIGQLVNRDIASRYRGSFMGVAWSFINPLLMLVVYTFFFTVVFKARWGVNGTGSKFEFALFLFAGIIVHTTFAECFNRAPNLILSNTNYVKKVVFPLEVLAPVTVISTLFNTLVAFFVLLLVELIVSGHVPLTAILFPIVIAPLLLLTVGITWIFAALGVFFRDIGQLTQILTTVLLFLSPVFYPMSAMPDKFRAWMLANPLTFIIEQSRMVVLLGQMPDWFGLAKYALTSIGVAWVGFFIFQRMRNGFADVL